MTTVSVREIWAPDETGRAGGLRPEGDLDRCACCGKRIAWRAVVDTADGLRVYGLTCAGVRTDAGKRRARAERLIASDPDWALWARRVATPTNIHHRPDTVLEAWAVAHGASAHEVNWRHLDAAGDPLPGLLSGTSVPKLERAAADLRELDSDFHAAADRVAWAHRLGRWVEVSLDGMDRGWLRRMATHGAPRMAGLAEVVTGLADRLTAPASAATDAA